ncbi:MAG: VOC family protein, partial [Gammaproteobacteria bacterium]|nr:VOC family protein [Gammaproteobacteria bacterium]
DHIGIAVFNMEESLKKYEKLFRIKAKHIETLEQFSVQIAFIPVGEVMLELIAPLAPGKGRIGEFLEKHGEGIHHIAYRVENLESSLAEMKKQGVKLIDEKPRGGGSGSWIAFLSPEETGNVLTELVEREKEL